MPISTASAPLAEILDEMTVEGATELTEHLPGNAGLGVHKIQFDTSRRYRRGNPVRDRYEITVF